MKRISLFFSVLSAGLFVASASFAQSSAAPADSSSPAASSPMKQMRSTMKADVQAVDSACANEAQTAGCPGAKIGKKHGEILKCIFKYKRAHRKDFKISEGCRSAIKTFRQEAHQMHEMREEHHRQ